MDGTTQGQAPQAAVLQVLDSLRALVEYQRTNGVRGFPRAARAPAVAPQPVRSAAPAAAASPPAGGTPSPVVKVPSSTADLFGEPGVAQAPSLEALRAHIGDCQRCKLARLGRSQVVFGVGNPNAALMFVGEGPGRDEDLQGEPFVGRAGQLLTEIITKGMKLRRSDVYIANVVKCRPPENRNPEPDEITTCLPFLARQVELVRPKVIVALGTFAAQALLGVRIPITRLRGMWHEYHGVRVMPTFHPAYLLRNPNDKKLVWVDIKMVMTELGMTP